MPALATEASLRIDAPMMRVSEAITDFHGWPSWSPWLYIEPGAKVDYRGEPGTTGHGYSWTGERVGAGSMSLASVTPDRIEMDLTFLKPFKSTAAVAFDLKKSGSSTDVTWQMNSSLPFFLFFMRDSMVAMIRADYDRGLLMLKDILEQGSLPSSTVSMGIVDMPEVAFVGHGGTTSMKQLGDAIAKSYGIAASAIHEAGNAIGGQPFTQYHKLNKKASTCLYTAPLPLSKPLASGVTIDLPAVAGHRAACRALKVVHTGAYRHIGNAWSTLQAELKASKLKPGKSPPPFEIYRNDPDTTPEGELITEIFMPLRE